MRPLTLTIVHTCFLLACFVPPAQSADLLVAMQGRGTVERYETGTGRHVGTFIRGVESVGRNKLAPFRHDRNPATECR